MNLLERDTAVNCLQRSMSDTSFGLSSVPEMLELILRDEAWKERTLHQSGEKVTFKTFAEFVETPIIRGLGSSVTQIKNLCRDNVVVLDLIDQALQRPNGIHDAVDIVNSTGRPDGNGRDGALRRLRKSRPDLHSKVLKKELTPHAAMIEAGFRRKTLTVPLDVEKAADVIKRHFTQQQIAQLMGYLKGSRYRGVA